MVSLVPKDKLSALLSETLATPKFSCGKDMTLKMLRKEVERRLGQALPREQKAQWMELVTEAMTREATKAVEAPPAPALAPTHCGGSDEDEDAQLAAALAMSVQQHGSAAMDEDPSPRNVIFR
jgi:hypothetical protein